MRRRWLWGGLVGLCTAGACGDDAPPYVDLPTVGAATSGVGGAGGAGGGEGGCTFEVAGGYGPFEDVCVTQPSDGVCLACTRERCCDVIEPCPNDPRCACLLECFLDGCNPVQCLVDCGQSDAVNALTQCASGECTDECT